MKAIKAKPQHLDTIRRAIRLAQDEDSLDLPIRVGIENRLAREAYTRTRNRLDANRASRAKH